MLMFASIFTGVTSPASTGKSIWVMGISVSTKAADLKVKFAV